MVVQPLLEGPSPAKLLEETRWLQANPQFDERPATLAEFLGPDYLDIDEDVRPGVRAVLVELMGDEVGTDRPVQYPQAILTGGIGIGKTTMAAVMLAYMVHWTLCLKDPQKYFGLMAGSRLAFMQMSTNENQAKEVIFGDLKARISNSPWFRKWPYDPAFKNQMRFPKEIWILPGGSAETRFEGYNILGGIIDEIDSHKVTDRRDYAEMGYETIWNRVSSRFEDRGFLVLIGQMKKATGFAARKFSEFQANPKFLADRMSIWESRGDDFYADDDGNVEKFWFDTFRKQIVSDQLAKIADSQFLIQIPTVYKEQFEINPEKALKDLAGIPPVVGDPFISLRHKIVEARERWVEHNNADSPLSPDGILAPWFKAQDTLKRVAHIDIAYSANGDALGLAMGHVREMIEIDGERKPYIVFDLVAQFTAPGGGEIFLADIRHFIYSLRADHGFKLDAVTLDGFQSQDTIQQFQRRRLNAYYVSVDKQLLPYHDLREAIYEDRIEFPPYMVKSRNRLGEFEEIAIKELTELVDAERKVDHPDGGSKDVADAMAGVVFTLMGDRRYHKNVVSIASFTAEKERRRVVGGIEHPAYLGDPGIRTPVPPRGLTSGSYDNR